MASERGVEGVTGDENKGAAMAESAGGESQCAKAVDTGAVIENKYEVQIVELESKHTVGIRKVVPYAEIANFFETAVPRLLEWAEKNNIPKPEVTYGRYYKCDKKIFDVECGMFVPKGTKGEGDIKANSLPSGKAASVFHYGCMGNIGKAYDALEKWMRKEGRLPGGCPFEYHDYEVMNAGDASKFKTQIFFPILTFIPPAIVKFFRK